MWPGLPHPRARMGVPSCTGPAIPDVPHQFFTTLELLNTGALSKSETLVFGLERKAVPGRTGSRTLELLFLLVGPGPSPAAPLHGPPEAPAPANGLSSVDNKRRRSFNISPVCPPPRCTLTFTVSRSGWINSRTPLKTPLRLCPGQTTCGDTCHQPMGEK